MDKYLNEVDSRLLNLTNKKIKIDDSINRIGLTVPVVRQELKRAHKFLNGSPSEILNTWDYIWKNTKYYESMSLPLYYYRGKSLSRSEFLTLKNWVERCFCWEHSDELSKLYAQVVEENPSWVLPTLKKWNSSKNPWKRRQSVVSLLEYSSKRKIILPFTELISFVDPLLDDSEYYVQKGIGWTLREIYNVYPVKTVSYIKKNLNRVNPLAYSAATEKIDKKTKSKFNEARKKQRALARK